MTTQEHYIDGKKVGLPRNWREVEIVVAFNENRINDESVGVREFIWQNKEAALLESIKTGNIGVTEGVPHQIFVSDTRTGINRLFFNGFIDLSRALYDRAELTAPSDLRTNNDWFTGVADSITFAELYRQGYLTESDTKFMPYVLELEGYIEISFMIYFGAAITIDLQQIIVKFVPESTIQIATVIDTAGGLIMLIFTIIYALVLIVILVKTILDIFDTLVQRAKYKPYMYALRQCEAVAAYFGLKFESQILSTNPYSKLAILPPSYSNPLQDQEERVRGFFRPNKQEQLGYYNGTAADFFALLKSIFNGRFTFGNGVMRFEPYNPTPKVGRFKIPSIENFKYRLNADEIPANFVLSFSIDDRVNFQNYLGTNYQVSRQQITTKDLQLRNMRGLQQVSINAARLPTKRELNIPEKLFNALFKVTGALLGGIIKVLNTASSLINKALKLFDTLKRAARVVGIRITLKTPQIPLIVDPKLGNLISNRIGMALLATDIISQHRVAIINEATEPRNTKINSQNDTLLSAKTLTERFYQNRVFRQGQIQEWSEVPMSLDDYLKVFEDEAVTLPDGNVAEVRIMEWNADKTTASLITFEPKVYTNNIKLSGDEPTGI